MRLIIQPDDGVAPLLSLIKGAKESVDMAIFRFDRRDLEKALRMAMNDGIKVSALIAYSNHGGEKNLRKLEMRFLEAGMTVARSANDLVRYHNKLIVIDRRVVCVLSFNFTHADIDRSRGFGIISDNAKWVTEASRLLESDVQRTPYTAEMDTFVVSPVNSRKAISDFLKGASKQLLIYDPKVSDREMIKILKDREKAGVEVRVIGQTKATFDVKKLSKLRLHTRTIIRDGQQAFIGSQSLRAAELDLRRELGLIVRHSQTVKKLMATFESDWDSGIAQDSSAAAQEKKPKAHKKKAVEALIKELDPVSTTIKQAVERVVAKTGDEILEDGKIKEAMKQVVKKVVKRAVKDAVA
jgi:phosphatidylserine/phosphatidylglycerophosphate/cardiolipin synthase-like enzyme